MKAKKTNRFFGGLLALMVLLSLLLPVSADDVEGSITLNLQSQGDKTPVAGGEITVYKVADASVAENNLDFAFTQAFAACGLSVQDYRNAEFVAGISDFIAENQLSGTALVTDEKGVAKFSGLAQGLYLIAQTKAAAGFASFAPFLVQLPMTQEGRLVYDLTVSPKVDVLRYTDITVQKLWNDGLAQRRDSVTVQLLWDNAVVDTAVLNEENGWTHTWKQQPLQEGYRVEETPVPKGYKATYKQSGFTFTVTNTPALAQTGQYNWPIPVLIVSGMILMVVGYILRNRGKRYV